jgi:hypothetical protein
MERLGIKKEPQWLLDQINKLSSDSRELPVSSCVVSKTSMSLCGSLTTTESESDLLTFEELGLGHVTGCRR